MLHKFNLEFVPLDWVVKGVVRCSTNLMVRFSIILVSMVILLVLWFWKNILRLIVFTTSSLNSFGAVESEILGEWCARCRHPVVVFRLVSG